MYVTDHTCVFCVLCAESVWCVREYVCAAECFVEMFLCLLMLAGFAVLPQLALSLGRQGEQQQWQQRP